MRAGYLLSTFCATKRISGIQDGLVISISGFGLHFKALATQTLKSGRTQSFLTGFTFRGDALKGCSEGNWRSGRRRSGDLAAGVQLTFLHLLYVPVSD